MNQSRNFSNDYNDQNYYYYPPYYYPKQNSPFPYQQQFSNYQQPLFFEVPNQFEHDSSIKNTVSPFVQYFQDDQGEIDIDKVIATTNQFMKTASQIAPMFKTLNDFVKGMKL
ncbi:YppG family protein [Piscibacillus halophilus]|uniref:YppG-like protein n=1 Tax=Piscibacillus halophilus TaxID=571933 RepID=A0A1H9LQQ6_9BACI|nr:YppG family protein [Piscibacillus halophilus]SER13495.1 YppG-like protein [Piscibacillus halophilus]